MLARPELMTGAGEPTLPSSLAVEVRHMRNTLMSQTGDWVEFTLGGLVV